MARVFFPTTSLNRFGVRDSDQRATLGAVERFPAEPTPRSAMTPTGPLLGAVVGLGLNTLQIRSDAPENFVGIARMVGVQPQPPIRFVNEAPLPPVSTVPPPAPTPIIQSSGGGGGVSQVVPAGVYFWQTAPSGAVAVSAQNSPTPVATLPAPAAPSAVLVSSGGGTQTPATAPVTAAAPTTAGSLVDGIAAWLGGTTSLLNYNVPNAVLAGVVVLGFAWLSSSSSGRKR